MAGESGVASRVREEIVIAECLFKREALSLEFRKGHVLPEDRRHGPVVGDRGGLLHRVDAGAASRVLPTLAILVVVQGLFLEFRDGGNLEPCSTADPKFVGKDGEDEGSIDEIGTDVDTELHAGAPVLEEIEDGEYDGGIHATHPDDLHLEGSLAIERFQSLADAGQNTPILLGHIDRDLGLAGNREEVADQLCEEGGHGS